MTATAEPPPVPAAEAPAQAPPAPVISVPLDRGEGVQLLGDVDGSGYKEGAALVRRADGQMVHLGPLMYGLLECVDGVRRRRRGRRRADRAARPSGCEAEHVVALAEKLAAQGLLAGTESMAPAAPEPAAGAALEGARHRPEADASG